MPLNTVMPIDLRALAPAPVAKDQRSHAENECERCHQDGPETRTGGINRGFQQRFLVADVQLPALLRQ
jgi:hypothetical protein